MTEQHWLELIDADPESTELRLVFADWLEEQGDPRAEGVRWQVVKKREPTKYYWDDTERIGWTWWRSDLTEWFAANIPPQIWEALNRELDEDYPSGKSWPTRIAAEQALWQAVVASRQKEEENNHGNLLPGAR